MDTRPHPAPASPGPGTAWDAAHAAWRIQVHGAGSARGRELVLALLAAGHPASRLKLYGRRARTLVGRDQRLAIEPLPSAPPPAELAFLCLPPELARRQSQALAARGTRVIDLASGSARRPEATLVLDERSGTDLGAFTTELVLPLASTALIAGPLAALDAAAGLAEVDLFAVVGAAALGATGILALRRELCAVGGAGGAPRRSAEARVGNLRPSETIRADFEGELTHELRTLLAQPELPLDAQAMAGDLERCDLFAVKALLHQPLDPEEARERFAAASGIALAADGGAPTPAASAGSATVQVGRIRSGSRGPRSLCFLAAGDQLVAGSAIAALRVAARLPAV